VPLADLLPIAHRNMRDLLTDPNTSDTVRPNTIKEVIRLNNIQPEKKGMDGWMDDKSELAEFWKGANIQIAEKMEVPDPQLPPGYQENIQK
jgi:hypothetical protein